MELTDDQIIETLEKWNFWEREIYTGIERNYYLEKIKLYLQTDEIIAVQGARRTGKSTILFQTLNYLINNGINKKNTLYINFEDETFFPFLKVELLKKILETYKNYFQPEGKIYVIFDEIQKINGWEHFVRSLYDKKENIKIFITGSSSKLLSSEYSTLLTGRHLLIEVYPLSFKEYLFFKGIKLNKKIDLIKNKNEIKLKSKEYLEEGGFPKVVLTENKTLQNDLLTNYFNDFINKDVIERYKIRDMVKIKNIALYYATNFCGFISFNSIKKSLEANSVETVEKYSHYLESSYLISFNKLFDYSLKKQLYNERKVYFIDNGMRNSVSFNFKDMYGNLLENAVYYELLREGFEIYYYKNKKETDFIIKKGLNIINAINVCYDFKDKKTREREIESLTECMHDFKLKNGIIITYDDEEIITKENKKIQVIPYYKYVLQNN